MSAASDYNGPLLSASFAYPLESLCLSMADYGGKMRAWMSLYHGVCVILDRRKRGQGAGHFSLYRVEPGDKADLGEIGRDGEDLSGDVLLNGEIFDRLAQAYVIRAAREVWLSLHVPDPNGLKQWPDDRQTPLCRVNVSLQPASEAML